MPGMKGLRQEYRLRVTKGETSAWKGGWENVTSGKQMDCVQEETLAVSATEVIVDKKHIRFVVLQKRRHRLTKKKKTFERFCHQGRESFWRKAGKRVNISSQESVRIRRVVFGVLSYVKITSLYRDANSATNVSLDRLRLVGSPIKSQRKVLEKDQLLCWWSLYNWVVYPKVTLQESLFGKQENWDRIAPSHSPRAHGTR